MPKPSRLFKLDAMPPKDGMKYQQSNSTKLARSRGKLSMNCDFCGMAYETHACWAKRVAHHFCSKSCSNLFKVIEVHKNCVICGADFVTIPSQVKRFSTCSIECLKEKRRIFMEYQAAHMDESPIFRFGDHECGEEIAIAKLSEDQVIKIRDMQGTQLEIAKIFGVSQTLISMIKNRLIWKHLP